MVAEYFVEEPTSERGPLPMFVTPAEHDVAYESERSPADDGVGAQQDWVTLRLMDSYN